MVNICGICDKVFNDGDEVCMTVEGKYRLVPSVRTFALYKNGLIYVPESLTHKECANKTDV